MKKQWIGLGFIIGISIASIAYSITAHRVTNASVESENQQDHEQNDPVDSASSTRQFLLVHELAEEQETRNTQLLNAFEENRLTVLEEYKNSAGAGKLVLAASPISNDLQNIRCNFDENAICALFFVEGEDRRLVLSGSEMVGFIGVESFSDENHAIISTSWSLYEYTSIVRKELNLQTNEIVPLLVFDVDQSMNFAELSISGKEGMRYALTVDGFRENGRLIPEKIVLTKGVQKKEVYSLSTVEIEQMQNNLRELGPEDRFDSLLVYPTDQDIASRQIHLDLFGEDFIIDLNDEVLKRS